MKLGQHVQLRQCPAMRGKIERISQGHADVKWDDGRITRVFASQLEAVKL